MKKMINIDDFSTNKKVDNKLFALILGIRGAGKSSVIGTLNTKTILISSSLESHGIQAAQALASSESIYSILYDIDSTTNKQLKADEALINLHNILDFLLTSEDIKNQIGAIALDSFSAVDKTLLATTRIASETNNWAAGDIMEIEHLNIIRKLKELHRKGFHILATMPIISLYDENGFYTEARQDIRGVRTASTICGIFPEILPILRYENQHIFQMDLTIKKSSKDVKKGTERATISNPRITGLTYQDLSSISEDLVLPADLSYIYKLKKTKLEGAINND